jgi:single-strand DNA-binding protein
MYNKVFLIGNLASDPEVRAAQSGTYVATARLATNIYAGKADDGTRREQTDFHNLVFFGKLAETVGAHLNKGGLIFIEGRLHSSSWDDAASGQKRYKTEVVVEEMKMLGRKAHEAAA